MNTTDIDKAHHWFAVEYNNRTWSLLAQDSRNEEENELMIHNAHASLMHWKEAGTQINELRAYYLLTNAYAAAGEGQAALRYADRSLALEQDKPEGLADWDTAFIYDAVARAHAADGNADLTQQYRNHAREAGELIANEEDRKIFNETFQSGNWHGM